MPCAVSARTAPRASVSLRAKTASNFCPEASSSSIASAPLDRCHFPPDTASSFGTGTPYSVSVSAYAPYRMAAVPTFSPGRMPMTAIRRRPCVEQVPDDGLGALDVVDHHVVDRAVEDPLAEQHHRRRRAQLLDVLGAEAERAVEQAVDRVAARPGERGQLAITVGAGGLDHHGQAVLTGGRDRRVGELGEVRVAQLGDGQADDAGPAGLEVPGRDVHLVAEGIDRGEHLGPGLLADVRVPVHHVGHRLR